ncbi:hypothetical protein ACI3KX_13015 [Microbacterium sp. ZW CA_36]|uniref:hypothetical protein n=1 Tax=Microbacterium sp. ZW CA_36 TaxID=3378078 RepID=UPI003851B4F8
MEFDRRFNPSEFDPHAAADERLRNLPYGPMALVADSMWTRAPIPGFVEELLGGRLVYSSVAFSYVPASSLERTDADGRRDLFAYKPDESMLWEAVRTSWKPVTHELDVREELVDHVAHILRNRFMEAPGAATTRQVQAASIEVDAREFPALELHGDGRVYGIGAKIGDVVLTAVIPRDAVAHGDLRFAGLAGPRTLSP